MTTNELYKHFRILIGNPSKEEVANDELRDHLIASFDWLANKLKYLVRQDNQGVTLVASQIEYPLPKDLLWIIWISWNNEKLTPASQYRWDRDESNFRTITASTPSEYAVQGDKLLLMPPASAAAIVTTPYLVVKSIVTPVVLEAGGPKGLADSDCWLALYKSAVRYLLPRRSDENQARIADYRLEIADLLPVAKARNDFPIDPYEPAWRPNTDRFGAAR